MSKEPPIRTCVVTREEHPQEALLRFAISPDEGVVFDMKGTLPGRGMWIKPKKHLVEQAVAKNLFTKSAKQKLRIPTDLVEQVDKQLKARALAMLARAYLAGDLVSGFEKVLSMLKSGDAAVLVHVEDAGADGLKKLNWYAQEIPVLTFCSREELGVALRKANPTHASLKKGGISAAFLDSYYRWAGFHVQDAL